MYSCCLELKFILKIPLKKQFFQFWPEKRNGSEMKIGYLAAILKRYNIFVCWNKVVISVHIHGVEII